MEKNVQKSNIKPEVPNRQPDKFSEPPRVQQEPKEKKDIPTVYEKNNADRKQAV